MKGPRESSPSCTSRIRASIYSAREASPSYPQLSGWAWLLAYSLYVRIWATAALDLRALTPSTAGSAQPSTKIRHAWRGFGGFRETPRKTSTIQKKGHSKQPPTEASIPHKLRPKAHSVNRPTSFFNQKKTRPWALRPNLSPAQGKQPRGSAQGSAGNLYTMLRNSSFSFLFYRLPKPNFGTQTWKED